MRKQKVAKTFAHFVRDSASLCFAYEILWNRRIEGGFCGFVHFACEILVILQNLGRKNSQNPRKAQIHRIHAKLQKSTKQRIFTQSSHPKLNKK